MATQRVEKIVTVRNGISADRDAEKVANYSAVDQFIYLVFGIIEILLLIRFTFRLFGANMAAGIAEFVYSITNFLMAPYRFIFPTNQVQGAVFEWSILVAMIFYALFAWIIMRLINIIYTAEN